MFVYKIRVCATEIHLDIEEDSIKNVEFIRGCETFSEFL